MKSKLLALSIGLLGTIAGAYLIWPELFPFCIQHVSDTGTHYCSHALLGRHDDVLFPLALALLVSSVFMLIASSRTFIRWVIFSIGYGILTLAALLILPQIKLDGGFIAFDLFPPEAVAETLSYIYVALSGLLFLISQHLPRPK